jgi:hypothetical protein
MSTILSKEVLAGLQEAQKRDRKKRSRRRVHMGEAVYPILESHDNGFTLDGEIDPRLRGLVDIYDGVRHLYQALIVASETDHGLIRYEYKRNTAASDHAPLDFYRNPDAPIALLGRSDS